VVLGTPGWLAPERILRNVADPAADIFTWGCLVAYAGTNRHPYGTGDPVAMAGRALHGEPDLEGLPAPLTDLVRTALDSDPAARPAARELLLTLTGGSTPDPVTTRPDLPPAPRTDEVLPSSTPAPGPGRRPWRRLALGGLVFVIGAALLVAGVLLLP
jgi:serine/threonine protein kinase